MNNRQLYKDTFSKLHTSNGMSGEEIRMKSKGGLRFKRRFVITVCLLVMIFAVTCIANAATGGELADKVKVWINGSEMDASAYEQEDGSLKFDLDANQSGVVEKDGKTQIEFQMGQGKGTFTITEDGGAEVALNEVTETEN